MAFRETIETQKAASAIGPYVGGEEAGMILALTSWQSQAIKAHPFIFTSGQLPADESGNIDLKLSVGSQTERCIRNIAAILEAGGSGLDLAVKVTVFITDMKDFAEVNAVYEKFFTSRPARSCVAVKELPKGVPVEIECVAVAR